MEDYAKKIILREQKLGSLLNELLDYFVKKNVSEDLFKKIFDCMEKELNRKLHFNNRDYKDFYQMDGKSWLDNTNELISHHLDAFLKKFPKTIWQFDNDPSLPEIYEK